MYLQPSTSVLYNDRRVLFALELLTGGHGQVFLSGGGTYVPTSSSYVFYRFDFLKNTTVSDVGFRSVAEDGSTVIYAVDPSEYSGITFNASQTWYAPVTSITLQNGEAIAYEYALFPAESLICSSSCNL